MVGRRHWQSRARGFALVLAMLVATEARGDATDDRRALVMLRVLAYDRQLAQRSAEELRLVVVYPAGDAGAAERARWSAAFAKVHKLKVDGRPVLVLAHKFESIESLDKALASLRPAALLACDGVPKQISKLTRTRKVMSFTTREADVAGGLAVGVVAGKVRDEIVVNLAAATAEGVKFEAGLLQLARSIKGAQP